MRRLLFSPVAAVYDRRTTRGLQAKLRRSQTAATGEATSARERAEFVRCGVALLSTRAAGSSVVVDSRVLKAARGPARSPKGAVPAPRLSVLSLGRRDACRPHSRDGRAPMRACGRATRTSPSAGRSRQDCDRRRRCRFAPPRARTSPPAATSPDKPLSRASRAGSTRQSSPGARYVARS